MDIEMRTVQGLVYETYTVECMTDSCTFKEMVDNVPQSLKALKEHCSDTAHEWIEVNHTMGFGTNYVTGSSPITQGSAEDIIEAENAE